MLRLFMPAAGLLRSLFAGRGTSARSVTASARLLLVGCCRSMLLPLPLLHVLGLLRCRELGVVRLL